MKRLLSISLALILGIAASAQGRLWVDESISLGYNRSYGMYDDDATMMGYDFKSGRSIRGGLKLQTGITSVEAGYKRPLSGNLGLESFATGQWNAAYNIQEYNFGFLGFWNWNNRVEVKAGAFFKLLAPKKGEGLEVEPFNFAYSFMFWALNTEKRFNFGASLSNLDMFTAERFYCPLLTIKARYRINRNYLVYAQFRQHNSGTFDLTSNLFDRQFRIGTVISW